MARSDGAAITSLLAEIARAHNTTSDSVRWEMEAAIDAAMKGDTRQRANMTAMIGHDGRPTLEEFLVAMAAAIQART